MLWTPSLVVIMIGSVLAVVGGLVAATLAGVAAPSLTPPTVALAIAAGGLVLALAGLFAATAGLLIPLARARLEARPEPPRGPDHSAEIHKANLKIIELSAKLEDAAVTLDENRRMIDALVVRARRDALADPADPPASGPEAK